jgi:hypothetical protein
MGGGKLILQQKHIHFTKLLEFWWVRNLKLNVEIRFRHLDTAYGMNRNNFTFTLASDTY